MHFSCKKLTFWLFQVSEVQTAFWNGFWEEETAHRLVKTTFKEDDVCKRESSAGGGLDGLHFILDKAFK